MLMCIRKLVRFLKAEIGTKKCIYKLSRLKKYENKSVNIRNSNDKSVSTTIS